MEVASRYKLFVNTVYTAYILFKLLYTVYILFKLLYTA